MKPAALATPTATQKPAATPTAAPAEAPAKTPEATEAPKTTATPEPAVAADNAVVVEVGEEGVIPEEVITEEVKESTGCETVEQLTSYIKTEMVKQFTGSSAEAPVFKEENIKVFEVAVLVGGQPATKENFPKDGVDVILPYPEGTNKADYDFVVGHMPCTDWNGTTPGVMEYPEVTKTDEGLKVHVSSASPFAVSWTEIANPVQSNDTAAGSSSFIWIIVGVLAVVVVGAAGFIVVQKKKKEEK